MPAWENSRLAKELAVPANSPRRGPWLPTSAGRRRLTSVNTSWQTQMSFVNWKKKKKCSLEVESSVYLAEIFRTSSPGDSISSSPERAAWRRWVGEPGFIEVLKQRAGSLNVKRLLLIKENQISQVKEFSVFLCMGRCKSLGSYQIADMHLSYLGPVSCVFTSWLSSGLTIGSGCSLMAAKMAGILFPPECPQGSQAHVEGLPSLMTVMSLFTDVTGNIPFLSCQSWHTGSHPWQGYEGENLTGKAGQVFRDSEKLPPALTLKMISVFLMPASIDYSLISVTQTEGLSDLFPNRNQFRTLISKFPGWWCFVRLSRVKGVF